MATHSSCPLVDSVKISVQNPKKCTNDTVSLLRKLLSAAEDERQPPAKKVANGHKRAPSTRRPGKSTSTRVTAKVTVFQARDDPVIPTLPKQNKIALATEIFNTSSKTLSEHIKRESSRPTGKTSNRNASTKPLASPKKPLQPTSPNRTILSPTKNKPLPGELSERDIAAGNIRAVAESALLALSSLRTLKCSDDEPLQLNAQLEQGLCILIGKLFAVGLDDMAVDELRRLKTRLNAALDGAVEKGAKEGGIANKRPGKEKAGENLEDLVQLSRIPKDAALLQLFISFQNLALRAFLSGNQSFAVQKLASHLMLSNPCCPSNLILEAYKSKTFSAEKAAQQLQALSSTVLSLAALTMSSGEVSSSSTRAKPPVTASLQVLSLEIRCLWWKIAGHKYDSEKELWDPLARYFSALARRCPTIKKPEFELVKQSFLRLKTTMEANGYETKLRNSKSSSISIVLRILGQLAYTAGCLPTAMEFSRSAAACLTADNPLQLAICRCRIAFIQTESLKTLVSNHIPATSAAIAEAAKDLSAPLKGNLADLDELLLEAAKLKKAVMRLTENIKGGAKIENNQGFDVDRIWPSIIEYLTSFTRFLSRYLGPAVPLDADQDSRNLFVQRLNSCKNIVVSAADSIIAVSRLSLNTGTPAWKEIEPLLSDCFALLCRLNYDRTEDEKTSDSASQSLLRLSNLYWSRYATLKEDGMSLFQLVPLLESSINILGRCARPEQLSGLIAIKLERLAAIYSEIGHELKAEANFSSAISAHIKIGTLEFATSQSDQKPPILVWKNPQNPAFALGRVLSSYIKARLKQTRKTAKLIYDDENLEPPSRGTLLEYQVTVLIDLLASDSSEAVCQCLSTVTSRLLSIYSKTRFPIRRARVILYYVRALLEYPVNFDPKFCELLKMEAQECLSRQRELFEDRSLHPYREDVMSSLRLSLGFYSDGISPDDLRTIIQSWNALAQDFTTWQSVETRVLDPQLWIYQLRSLVDYLEVKALWTLQIAVMSVLKRVLELQKNRDISMHVTVLSMLGLQLNRLGLPNAGEIFTSAKDLTTEQSLCPTVLVAWRLAHAEYVMDSGSQEDSLEILREAQALFETRLGDGTKESIRTRNLIDKLGIDAASLFSKIALADGRLTDAIFYAKCAVKLSMRLWARLEKYAASKMERKSPTNSQTKVENLAEKLSTIDISGTVDFVQQYRTGSIYWPYFWCHYAALRQLARLSAYNGLYQDATYYAQMALDASKAVGTPGLATFITAELSSYYLRGNQPEKGRALQGEADAEMSLIDESIHKIELQYHLSAIHRYTGESENEYQMLDTCRNSLLNLSLNENNLLHITNSEIADVRSQFEDLSLESTTSIPSQRKSKRVARVAKPKSQGEALVSGGGGRTPNPLLSSKLYGEVRRRQATLLISEQRLEDAAVILNELDNSTSSKDGDFLSCILKASYHMREVIDKLTNHGVYCVLPESCIALLSFQFASQETSLIARTPKTPRKKAKSPVCSREGFVETLSSAKERLDSILSLAITHSSATGGHLFSYLASRMSALFYATSKGYGRIDPRHSVQLIETGRNSAFLRDQYSILADRQLNQATKLPRWPTAPGIGTKSDVLQSPSFIHECIGLLPQTWNVISISLGADGNEFVISKLRADQEPFTLCLPIKRSESEDEEVQNFCFQDGKNELIEIIQMANKSAHDAGSHVNKKAKKEWWANRESLDVRLRDLLLNMENIWFGGFRGIFSQKPKNEILFARFIDSFEKILDKHLPSRRGKRSKTKTSGLKFDSNVIELFVSLKNISDEDDPEDSVMDLLYFVVDALQFQGERNAYDEIDFDMMVVEILDAIRSYADAERRDDQMCSQMHTILILDKALHPFPWESFDCLQGCSVSRMPSLYSLYERLVTIRAQKRPTASTHGLYINKQSGTYILNPGGDLKSTQCTFQDPLSRLDSWTNFTQRDPTEEEFKEALESKDIVLYFGHGSGAQYIRGRTIRRLDRCAVTFLMGCSSGALTEAGEFEPYGTPWNYMQAGSAALVATLWDVTDKDIDRFTERVFQRWGLISSSQKKMKSGRTSKRGEEKPEDVNSEFEIGNNSADGLDTAIANSRDSCILRYLNGAAPVVYGVPVFLE